MKVAGIDFSSHAVDVVTVPYDGVGAPVWTRWPLVGSDAFDRARSVSQAVPGPSSVFWEDCLAVGIESPGARHPGVNALWRIQGAILARIPARMLVQPWPPAAWRKAVGIKGNADKGQVALKSTLQRVAKPIPCLESKESEVFALMDATLRTIELAELPDWPQDAHDAHLIALATRQAITTEKAA